MTLLNPTTVDPSFTSPAGLLQDTALTFNLVVNDGQVDSAADSVVITVLASQPGNGAPVADAGPDQTVAENQPVILDGSGSYDPDSDLLTYLWQQAASDPVQVTLLNPTSVDPSFTSPLGLSQDTALTFNLVVNDGQVDSAANSVVITVLASQQTYSNIAPLATVTASSQNTSTGQLAVKAVDGFIDGYPGVYTREWATTGELAGAWITLSWASAHEVDTIVLYDRPNLVDNILSGTLTFSDGTSETVGPLPNDGSGYTVTFTPHTINWVTLTIDSAVGLNIGLSEIEVP